MVLPDDGQHGTIYDNFFCRGQQPSKNVFFAFTMFYDKYFSKSTKSLELSHILLYVENSIWAVQKQKKTAIIVAWPIALSYKMFCIYVQVGFVCVCAYVDWVWFRYLCARPSMWKLRQQFSIDIFNFGDWNCIQEIRNIIKLIDIILSITLFFTYLSSFHFIRALTIFFWL